MASRPAAACLTAGLAMGSLLAVVPAPASAKPVPPAQLVAERRAALARANAKVTGQSQELSTLETRAEELTEQYDQAASAEQQASAAYQVAASRLAAANRKRQADTQRLAEQADADLEADGGVGELAAMFGGPGSPEAYASAVGVEEAVADNRVDLVAASQADAAVTRVFASQADALLRARRTDLTRADELKRAVQSAVAIQLGAVKAAQTQRGQAQSDLTRALMAIGMVSRTAGVPGGAGALSDTAGYGDADTPAWTPGEPAATAAQGAIAASWALSQLGKPYQWGGAGPGSYDCSGLAMDAWARAGIQLAHWTGYQWKSGPRVPLNALRAGDLVFYATDTADPATIHHVGIYIGGGMMVDAPYTGANVRIDSIHQYSGLIGAIRPAV
ncbi:MAG TPA: NlpC/P60 family protein [Trebonia sp.]